MNNRFPFNHIDQHISYSQNRLQENVARFNAEVQRREEIRKQRTLKIDKQLPQILVPASKTEMLIKWWNSDIRFEKTVPMAFRSGYLIFDNIQNELDPEKMKLTFKETARTLGLSYRAVENTYKEFMSQSRQITMYFTFTKDNSIYAETFDVNGGILSTITMTIGDTSEPEHEISLVATPSTNMNDILDDMNYFNMAILITSLWYIATATKSTKYIYEKKSPVILARHKDEVIVSDTKTINTPIYDIGKVKTVKVDSLISRKKGWTYSHSFQVHGHYRHYKNGKTVFIQSYIKGKDKEFKAQKLIIEPK